MGGLTDGWTEYSEGVIMANLEYIQAQQMVGRTQLSANDPVVHNDRWDTLRLFLRSMGFDPDKTDAWQGVGVDRGAGRGPTLELLADRARKGRLLLAAAQNVAIWSPEDKARAGKAELNR
jgi:hypothetical protein